MKYILFHSENPVCELFFNAHHHIEKERTITIFPKKQTVSRPR